MCLLYMRCSIPVVFTHVAVLSCPVGKGGCTCEIWFVSIVWEEKIGVFESHLYNSSIMFDYSYLCSLFNSLFLHDYLSSIEPVIHSPAWPLFFCSLKINHDSHGFILEFDTVRNTYSFVNLVRPQTMAVPFVLSDVRSMVTHIYINVHSYIILCW